MNMLRLKQVCFCCMPRIARIHNQTIMFFKDFYSHKCHKRKEERNLYLGDLTYKPIPKIQKNGTWESRD